MSIEDDLAEAIAPWYTLDLEVLARGLGQMFKQVELYADDDPAGDGNDGWSILLDVDRCPAEALPYLAQWSGETLPQGLAEADARQWIKDSPNRRRGTPVSIAQAAQRSLTGARTVMLIERETGSGPDPNGDNFIVYTYVDETPNPAQVWQDLLTTIPADMVCTYQTVTGSTWADVDATYATWAAVASANANWAAVQGARPGSSVWTR